MWKILWMLIGKKTQTEISIIHEDIPNSLNEFILWNLMMTSSNNLEHVMKLAFQR